MAIRVPASGTSVVTVSGTSETVTAAAGNTYRRYTAAGATTVTLPAGVAAGVLFHGRAVGAGGVTVDDDGSSTVNGAGSVAQGSEFSAISVGSDTWDVVGTS